jgi:hypothetical protein
MSKTYRPARVVDGKLVLMDMSEMLEKFAKQVNRPTSVNVPKRTAITDGNTIKLTGGWHKPTGSLGSPSHFGVAASSPHYGAGKRANGNGKKRK